MSFSSSSRSRIVYSSSSSLALLVLVFLYLHIWLCLCPDCKAGATRMLAENGVAAKLKDSHRAPKRLPLHKFFHGSGASSFNKTEKGLEESKKAVPSCPDPLHN
uniref:CLAVATA3/ESR CLE-related protein 27 n=1 Tax=Rhizophora mucronata TaxID=61149 RepID=A0A2P2JE92_RHIMU